MKNVKDIKAIVLTLASLVLFLLCSLSAQGQVALSADCNKFRDGDSLLKVQIPYVSAARPEIMSLDKDHAVAYVQKFRQMGDTMACSEHGTLYYYMVKGDNLTLLGFENRTSRMDYHVPQCQQPWSFALGDSTSGCFYAGGCYGEKLYLEVLGRNTAVADRMCNVIFKGDTLRNCLLVHRRYEMSRQVGLEEYCRQDACSDSIAVWLEAENDRLVEDHWLWYVPGWRYPVLESIDTYHTEGGERVDNFSTSFLYLPEWQDEDLATDVENNLVRMKQRQELLDADSGDDDAGFPIHMTASLGGDGTSLALSYEQTEGGTVKFIVCDQAARPLASASYTQDAGHYQNILRLQTMPPENIIVLYLEINGKNMSMKIYK